MRVAIAQIAPVLLDRQATTEKVIHSIQQAGQAGAKLVTFGESLIPAYPFWLCRMDGARFECDEVKDVHARYLDQGVCLEDGHLEPICTAAREAECSVVLGVAERAGDRGGHSLYCSCITILPDGTIGSVHRKLMPTYEERLAWGVGDGNGLVTHQLEPFTLSALNCWENWMPLARAALYAQGTNLHVAIWPGCLRLTQDITRFIAFESRSFVISASAIIRPEDVPADVPQRAQMVGDEPIFYDGGSCIAGPDGEWLIEPQVEHEGLFSAELDIDSIRRERQNFDPAGHYSRPDVTRLVVDRTRQGTVSFED